MSRQEIYSVPMGHVRGCMCSGCHRPEPMPAPMPVPQLNSYQEPMRTLSVGTAPVHLVTDGVIVETTTDKYGREICEYRIDPAYAADLTSQRVCDAFAAMDADGLLKVMALLLPSLDPALEANEQACAALAAGLISEDPANTIRTGSDGKLFENDAVI